MTNEVLLAHFYALRAHMEAVILQTERELGVSQPEPGSCPECGAQPDKVADTSTLDGTKRSRCTVCQHEWER